MITIKNRLIPFSGFAALTLWPFVFVRQDLSERGRRHEGTHLAQELEVMMAMCAIVGAAMIMGASPWWLVLVPATYYILYVAEWLVRLLLYRDRTEAYRNISTEQEAYLHENEALYLTERQPFAWLRYLTRKTWRKVR